MIPENIIDMFQKQKQKRIAYVVYELVQRGGEASLKEFRGSIDVNWGMKGKTQDEYYEDLKDTGIIRITGNTISLLWSKDEAENWLKKQGIAIVKHGQ
jgi:hypothetical protein